MDQSSLQALLLELRGLDEAAPKAEEDAATHDRASEAKNHAGDGNGAVDSTSDYTAWYEDYVKATAPTAVAPSVAPAEVATHAINSQEEHIPPSQHPHHHHTQTPQDLRKLTYAQALPIISRLAADEAFLDALQELKATQETFELSLLDERNRAKADLEKQLRRAREAAVASGTQYEVERISKLLTATMTKFDKGALSRWDALARDQQARLEQLGVPCFYVLKNADPVAQERQRRVIETLNTLLSDV